MEDKAEPSAQGGADVRAEWAALEEIQGEGGEQPPPAPELYVYLCSGGREVLAGPAKVIVTPDRILIVDGERLVASYPAGGVYFISSGGCAPPSWY
jgi:hypothetical protein